jgi:hypothetical protein
MGKVFINEDVFPSDSDYSIGGFETDKESGFTISDIKTGLINKLSRLIDTYLENATAFNAECGIENPKEYAKVNLAAVLLDNLQIHTPYLDKETMISEIINCDKTQKWLFGIQNNIKIAINQTVSIGVENQSLNIDESSPQYQEAKELSENTTLEEVVEQLSMIEL